MADGGAQSGAGLWIAKRSISHVMAVRVRFQRGDASFCTTYPCAVLADGQEMCFRLQTPDWINGHRAARRMKVSVPHGCYRISTQRFLDFWYGYAIIVVVFRWATIRTPSVIQEAP